MADELARVEPLVQPVEDLVAAEAVVARDQHEHGGLPALLHVELRVQELHPQLGELSLELFLGERVSFFGVVEQRHALSLTEAPRSGLRSVTRRARRRSGAAPRSRR